MLKDTLERLKNENLLSRITGEGLEVINPKTPNFYSTPKIHKENNPGRPVINLINCHTSDIPRFVEHHLQPLAKKLHHILKIPMILQAK